MGVITEAIHERLVNDAALTALLATYNGVPAVFTTEPVPKDAALPYIVSSGEATNDAFDTKVSSGRRITRDIRCYTETTDSVALVEAMAERVVALFHRHKLSVDGFRTIIADASGPISAEEELAHGRIVSVRLTLVAN